MTKKIVLVAGARPNFIKIAPLVKEFKNYRKHFRVRIVHTGQHYDFEMSDVFFQELKIPKPDIYLNVGSASHAVQIAKIMIAFEKVLLDEKPDLIIVVGDVNSTLACSLVAAKLGVKIAHVEAGLRSFDRTMPEEINRAITDSLSDYLFVTEESGIKNIIREGIDRSKIFFVGNVMIDTLLSNMACINRSGILNHLDLKPHSYAVLTLHRPSNVDNRQTLLSIYRILKSLPVKIIYPIHPRARKMMRNNGVLDKFEALDNLKMISPLGYIDFTKLIKESKFTMTDSGGIQEETTVLKIPCLTMRKNTERPVTIEEGTNFLVGLSIKKIEKIVNDILTKGWRKKSRVPKFWDGHASERIVRKICEVI